MGASHPEEFRTAKREHKGHLVFQVSHVHILVVEGKGFRKHKQALICFRLVEQCYSSLKNSGCGRLGLWHTHAQQLFVCDALPLQYM